MNSKCADCGHEECRCDRPPMPAASPWRYDVENAPKDGSEVVGGWHEADGHFCHNRYGWDSRAECWKWDDSKFDLVPFVAWTIMNPPEVKPYAFATINQPETPND